MYPLDRSKVIYEVNLQPSATVPDMSMTMREIITKYSQGLSVANVHTPVYNYDDAGNLLGGEYPNINSLDISERYDLLQLNAVKIADLRKQEADNNVKARNERMKHLKDADAHAKLLADMSALHAKMSGDSKPV